MTRQTHRFDVTTRCRTVQVVAGQLGQLQEGRPWVQQCRDALPWQQLASCSIALDGFEPTALACAGYVDVEPADEGLHGLGIFLKVCRQWMGTSDIKYICVVFDKRIDGSVGASMVPRAS